MGIIGQSLFITLMLNMEFVAWYFDYFFKELDSSLRWNDDVFGVTCKVFLDSSLRWNDDPIGVMSVNVWNDDPLGVTCKVFSGFQPAQASVTLTSVGSFTDFSRFCTI